MINPRRASVSAALIVMVCFFLPWVQVSCGRSEETIAGIDLAREGHGELWLIPLFMLAVVVSHFIRTLKDRAQILALVSFIAGVVSAFLMNRERLRAEDTTALLVVRVSVWLWLGLASAIMLAFIGALQLVKRQKTT